MPLKRAVREAEELLRQCEQILAESKQVLKEFEIITRQSRELSQRARSTIGELRQESAHIRFTIEKSHAHRSPPSVHEPFGRAG